MKLMKKIKYALTPEDERTFAQYLEAHPKAAAQIERRRAGLKND